MLGLPLLPVLIAALLVLVVGGTAQVEYVRLMTSTSRRLLRPPWTVAVARDLRSVVVRLLLLPLSAPHLVDVVTGFARVPLAGSERDAVGTVGPATLWRYRPRGPVTGPPVLLVHSVVTRPWVLDLVPGASLVEALVDAGFDVYLLDWGTPGPAQAQVGLSGYVDVVAWAELQACRAAGSSRVHVVGYCFGGTLALALHGAVGTERLASLTLLAVPVDTGVAGGMGRFLSGPFTPPLLLLDGRSMVPGALVREAFHFLRPRAWQSARRVWRQRKDAAFRGWAGAFGRWAWEQPPLPGAVLFDIVDLYRTNRLLNGRLHVSGQRVDLSRLAGVPMLLATTVRDHIVPPASTHALATVRGLAPELLQCRGGHVSMLAGREGAEVLYPGLVQWLRGVQHPQAPSLPRLSPPV